MCNRMLNYLTHLLELELLDSGFIGGDGGAFDSDLVLLDGLGGIHGDLVVGLVSVLNSQIVVFNVHIEVGGDELVFN